MSDGPPALNGKRPLFMDAEAVDASLPDLGPDEVPDVRVYDAVEEFPSRSEYLNERQWLVCWHHVQGRTNNQICTITGYTPSWVSTILKSPAMIEQINRLRAVAHGDALGEIKRMDWEFLQTVKAHLRDPSVDITDKVQTAKWGFEQNHGKAKQSVDVKNTYIDYVEVVKQLIAAGEPAKPAEFRDVGELPEPPGDVAQAGRPDFRKWFDEKP